MKITWLGQFGILLQTENTCLMVDPYLTDSIAEQSGPGFRRLVPLREDYLARKPEVILLSHDHTDHVDLPSLHALLDTPQPAEVLAGANAWTKTRTEVGGPHNYIRMVPGAEWSTRDLRIRAVPAIHSDPTAIGFVWLVSSALCWVVAVVTALSGVKYLWDNRSFINTAK